MRTVWVYHSVLILVLRSSVLHHKFIDMHLSTCFINVKVMEGLSHASLLVFTLCALLSALSFICLLYLIPFKHFVDIRFIVSFTLLSSPILSFFAHSTVRHSFPSCVMFTGLPLPQRLDISQNIPSCISNRSFSHLFHFHNFLSSLVLLNVTIPSSSLWRPCFLFPSPSRPLTWPAWKDGVWRP